MEGNTQVVEPLEVSDICSDASTLLSFYALTSGHRLQNCYIFTYIITQNPVYSHLKIDTSD